MDSLRSPLTPDVRQLPPAPLPSFASFNVTRKSKSRIGVIVGSGCLGLAVGPLLLFVLLQSVLGMFPGNNGLGLGLWFMVATPVSAVALALGVAFDARRNRLPRP